MSHDKKKQTKILLVEVLADVFEVFLAVDNKNLLVILYGNIWSSHLIKQIRLDWNTQIRNCNTGQRWIISGTAGTKKEAKTQAATAALGDLHKTKMLRKDKNKDSLLVASLKSIWIHQYPWLFYRVKENFNFLKRI